MKARVSLKVRAGARRTEIGGRHGEAWKLHIAAPPVDGKANEAVIRFLATLVRVPVSAVRIVTGLTSTNKLAEIEGVSAEQLADQLERAMLDSHGPRKNSGSSSTAEP